MAFSNAPIGMALVANDGAFMQVNKALCKFLGYSKEEMLAKTVSDVSYQGELEKLREYERQMQKGEIDFFYMEKRYTHKDGHVIWGLLSVSTIRDAKGSSLFMIAHVQDITDRKRSIQLGEALNDINRAINATLDFETIMQRVVIKAAEAMKCDKTSIILRDNDHFVVQYSQGCQADLKKRLSQEEIKMFVPMHDSLLVVEDSCQNEKIDSAVAKKNQACAILSVPLTSKDEQIGSIVFSNKKPTSFIQPEIDFAQKLAISISLAVENARLYETEHMIANTLQKALLTIPEKITGINFSHMYRSATKAAMVGGDVGDVSGKGTRLRPLHRW